MGNPRLANRRAPVIEYNVLLLATYEVEIDFKYFAFIFSLVPFSPASIP